MNAIPLSEFQKSCLHADVDFIMRTCALIPDLTIARKKCKLCGGVLESRVTTQEARTREWKPRWVLVDPTKMWHNRLT